MLYFSCSIKCTLSCRQTLLQIPITYSIRRHTTVNHTTDVISQYLAITLVILCKPEAYYSFRPGTSDVNKTFLSRPRPRPRLFSQDQGKTFYFKTKTKTKTFLGQMNFLLMYHGHKTNTTVCTHWCMYVPSIILLTRNKSSYSKKHHRLKIIHCHWTCKYIAMKGNKAWKAMQLAAIRQKFKNHDGKVLKIPKTFLSRPRPRPRLFFVLEAPRDQDLGLEADITARKWSHRPITTHPVLRVLLLVRATVFKKA